MPATLQVFLYNIVLPPRVHPHTRGCSHLLPLPIPLLLSCHTALSLALNLDPNADPDNTCSVQRRRCCSTVRFEL